MKAKPLLACLSILATCSGLAMADDPPTQYPAWETANGIPGAGADVDSDGDGIPNGIEFVIGGDPSGPNSDSNSLLPSVTVDATYLNFIYRKTDASVDYNPLVEYSNSLGNWTEAQGGVDGVEVQDALEYEPGVTLVTVKIPRALAAPGFALFARLRFETPP